MVGLLNFFHRASAPTKSSTKRSSDAQKMSGQGASSKEEVEATYDVVAVPPGGRPRHAETIIKFQVEGSSTERRG